MKKLTTLLFSTLSFTAFAQVPVEWTRSYNGPADNDDEAIDMAIDASGNAYVTGTSFATNGTYDITTVMYSAAGVQQWVATYNGTGNNNDGADAVAVDANGNVYVTGRARSVSNLEDIVTIKYNASGIQQWAVTYNGSGNGLDEGKDVTVDASGNVYVTGYFSLSNNYTDMITIKYDAAGNQQWATPFNGVNNGSDEGDAIILDGTGNLYVCGKGNENQSSGLSDIVTIKYNCSAGAQQWLRAYDAGVSDNDYGRAITLDQAGNVIVTGQSFYTGLWFDIATIKYDAAGTQQWAMRYNFGANKYEDAKSITTDLNNNVFVAGYGQGTGTGNDGVLIKYNAAGAQQWVSRYTSTGNNDDRFFSVVCDDTANAYTTGYMTLSSTNKDYATVKYNSAGTQKWIATYDGAGNGFDYGAVIGIGSASEIYVTGYADANTGVNTNNDYVTIKYATANIGFAEYNNTISDIVMYPNPTTGNSTISISAEFLKENTKLYLSVYDVTGREVVSQKDFTCNNSFATFSLSNIQLAKGVYTIKLNDSSKQFTGVGRLVIQ
jgi:hypothetical protein